MNCYFFPKVKEVRRSRNFDPSIWNIHLKVCKFLLQLRQNISVPGLGRYLEQEMATYSWEIPWTEEPGILAWEIPWTEEPSILAWEIPWTEEPGWLQFIGSQRVRCDLVTKQTTATILIPHVMTGVCVQVYAFFKTHQRVHSRFFHCVHWGEKKMYNLEVENCFIWGFLRTITWDGSLSDSSEELFQRGRGKSQYIY